jgi:hypothetical protein
LTRLALPFLAALSVAHYRPVAAQGPPLDAVLSNVASYLRDYVPRLARVVASEDYEQRFTITSTTQRLGAAGVNSQTTKSNEVRRLRSEVMLVRYPVGDVDWMWFRDVLEVNGKLLPHDADRPIKLFVTPHSGAADQAARIAYEDFRYHAGGATVPATNPLLVLALMQKHYQSRLRFKLGDAEKSLGVNARAVKFEEREEANSSTARKDRETPPALPGPAGRIHGTIWVDVQTGELLKTEARIGELAGRTMTTTTFAPDARLALLVPKEMRTTWIYTKGGPVVGAARYSNFRRFETTTDTQQLDRPR